MLRTESPPEDELLCVRGPPVEEAGKSEKLESFESEDSGEEGCWLSTPVKPYISMLSFVSKLLSGS